jgi:Cu/Ag efflux protein CusF
MTRTPSLVLALALAAAFPHVALAQGAAAATVTGQAPNARLAAGEIEIRAKVVELDTARRLVTLKGPKGNIVTLEVPAEVKNFDQIRLGDDVVVRYAAAVAARLEPATRSGIRERVESTSAASAAAGGMPGAAAQRTVEVLVVITALDAKAGTATLRGAKRTVTVQIPPGVDIKKLKVGDEVRAVIVEALVLNVERLAKAR